MINEPYSVIELTHVGIGRSIACGLQGAQHRKGMQCERSRRGRIAQHQCVGEVRSESCHNHGRDVKYQS